MVQKNTTARSGEVGAVAACKWPPGWDVVRPARWIRCTAELWRSFRAWWLQGRLERLDEREWELMSYYRAAKTAEEIEHWSIELDELRGERARLVCALADVSHKLRIIYLAKRLL